MRIRYFFLCIVSGFQCSQLNFMFITRPVKLLMKLLLDYNTKLIQIKVYYTQSSLYVIALLPLNVTVSTSPVVEIKN